MSLKKPKVVVVVHDAGGAEVIGAYMAAHRQYDFRAFGNGPALGVFRRLKIPLRKVGSTSRELAAVMHCHRDARYALLGAPGWMTETEVHALQEARKAGLKTIIYMDSWIDHRERFGYPKKGWEENLPDALWAGDHYSRNDLLSQFPGIPVRLVANQYMRNEVSRYRKQKKVSSRPSVVLFVSSADQASKELLALLLDTFSRFPTHPTLRIRNHPGDDRAAYDTLLARAAGRVRVEVSREKDLVNDLVRAQAVVGTETVAMAVATLCRIPTFGLWAKHTRRVLPFDSIIMAPTISELVKNAQKKFF